MYRFRREDQLLPDYEVASFYLCQHPGSFFRRDLVGALAIPGGRLALRNNVLNTYRRGQPVEHRTLTTPAELRDVLERLLHVRLPDHPGLEPALASISSR
jgi:N-hydroxyarylamine O-acetyltransferase